MKKIFIALPFVLIFAYLFIAYAGFYHFIGKMALPSPYTQKAITLDNPEADNSILYVALGDSLTAGVGSEDVTTTFVYQYAQYLHDQGHTVDLINLGAPGSATKDVIKYQLDEAIKDNPQYVTLLIGINDIHAKVSAATYKKNLSYILDQLTTKTNAKIKLINLPYIGSTHIIFPPFNYLLNFRTKQFNTIIQSLAQQRGLQVVDLYSATYAQSQNDPNYYARDLYHPSGYGYMIWKNIINAD